MYIIYNAQNCQRKRLLKSNPIHVSPVIAWKIIPTSTFRMLLLPQKRILTGSRSISPTLNSGGVLQVIGSISVRILSGMHFQKCTSEGPLPHPARSDSTEMWCSHLALLSHFMWDKFEAGDLVLVYSYC